MSEVLFILTTIYVAYVIYKVADEPKTAARPSSQPTILTPTAVAESAVEEAVTERAEEPTPVLENAVSLPEAQQPSAPVSSSHLRDPETGEAAKVTNNYRGLKRWLKEALVAEGLLDKVYSNSELNDETNAKIREALEIMKTLTKYHA